MRICGIKMTHDAAVAVIDDGKLLFSTELEKVGNGDRYTAMRSEEEIEAALKEFGLRRQDIDLFVLDGWKGGKMYACGKEWSVAPYHEFDPPDANIDLLTPYIHTGYVSFSHLSGHVLGAYVTSPFAHKIESSYVITWDGGMQPRVHKVCDHKVEFVGTLFEFYGILYGVMGLYFGPYASKETIEYNGPDWRSMIVKHGSFGIPGKLMSYIALGQPNEQLIAWMHGHYLTVLKSLQRNHLAYNHDRSLEFKFMQGVYEYVKANMPELSDADVLASVHLLLERMLVAEACAMIPAGNNLCFTGGCALNIKWNSALREANHFKDIWIPPFPNDCGSAIGAAICGMIVYDHKWDLEWDVYAGPGLRRPVVLPGWFEQECSIATLARLLANNPSEPVVMLNDRAELGPRALGNRSILCGATVASNKQLLNAIKKREDFRPVAPICMEEYASNIFDPGTPDPYMLFDHHVRDEWLDKVPAIVHLDQTARLQTVDRSQNYVIHQLLRDYMGLTGIPLLCNTSANYNGKGFFPDVASAMEWGQVKYIWSDWKLYTKEN